LNWRLILPTKSKYTMSQFLGSEFLPEDTENEDSSEGANSFSSSDEFGSIPPFSGSMSLNSDTLQDFGSIVSLSPGTLLGLFQSHQMDHVDHVDDGAQTIISSAPSGSEIELRVASQEIWALSPHPFLPGTAISISTCCTDAISFQRLVQDTASSGEDDSSLSTTGVHHPDLSPERHDPVSFVAVADRLLRESTNGGYWYSNFTERDWDQFQQAARMIMYTLEPPRPPLEFPPSPPESSDNAYRIQTVDASYSAAEILPKPFICPLCLDAIVGALTLDCGCATSTVCTLCWEEHLQGMMSQNDVSHQLGYVWVERCPSCFSTVHTSLPCHALDVAMLQIIQSLPSDIDKTSMKHHYYARLRGWGEKVVQRHKEQDLQEFSRHDEMLARLIQEEEKVLWEKNRKRERSTSPATRSFIVLGQAAMALLAATVASMGLNALAARR
jgi:hypothetical protein